MGWDLPPLRSWLAMLCVALAVTFAGSSAASAVDHVQHDMQLQHEHGLQLTASHDDHHPPAHAADHEPAHDDAADDPSGGPGHHHADAPSAALGGGPQASPSAALESAALQMIPSQPAAGVPPGGPERPPRAIAKPV